MAEVTLLLEQLSRGDRSREDELFSLVYENLRRLAAAHMRRERVEHTLQPTALVNEVYLRLVGDSQINWESRAHFYNAAAKMMRRILVDHARGTFAIKRQGSLARVELGPDLAVSRFTDPVELLAVESALSRMEQLDPRAARVVELRFFGGLNVDEAARVLAVSPKTVKRDWEFARAFFETQLRSATAGNA